MSMNKYINNTFITIPPTKKNGTKNWDKYTYILYKYTYKCVCVCIYI